MIRQTLASVDQCFDRLGEWFSNRLFKAIIQYANDKVIGMLLDIMAEDCCIAVASVNTRKVLSKSLLPRMNELIRSKCAVTEHYRRDESMGNRLGLRRI